MRNTIQENDIRNGCSYCERMKNEIYTLISEGEKEFSLDIDICKNRLEQEKSDVLMLSNDVNKSLALIDSNSSFITAHEKTVLQLNEEIKSFDSNIKLTPTTRKVTKKDENGNEISYEEQIKENILKIEKWKSQIDENKNKIIVLNGKIERNKKNISELHGIIGRLNIIIKNKNDFITDINLSINDLNNKFYNYKKTLGNCGDSLDNLRKKLSNCADYINLYGQAMKGIIYRNFKNETVKVSYSSDDVISVTSDALREEIKILKRSINYTEAFLNRLSKQKSKFTDLLRDSIVDQTDEFISGSMKTIKKINDTYKETIKKLNKAERYLVEYENAMR